MICYHGSSRIIQKPVYGAGNPHNDYGLAFYCTEDAHMAAEWSVAEDRDGFVNAYELHTEGLKILDLNGGDHHILNWLAILLENRTFRLTSDLMVSGKEYILKHFKPEYQEYDLVRGYRADDSYFSFAGAFLNNAISLRQLEKAMVLGKMGEQIAVVSKDAFGQLVFQKADPVDREIYYPQKMARDRLAREKFAGEKENPAEGIYLVDIIRQKWENDDERLQRIIYR